MEERAACRRVDVAVGAEQVRIMRSGIEFSALLFLGAVAVTACGTDEPALKAEVEAPLLPSDIETRLPPSVRDVVLMPFSGDLDEIVRRRAVRIGVTFNRTFYFVDRGVQRGIAYDYGQLMETRLNEHFKTRTGNRIHVIFMPLPRELLLTALVDGKVDMVAAQIPATPALERDVTFSDPTRKNVAQILVTGPGAPPIASLEDLSGGEVFARELGGYSQGLLTLNERFASQGKAPIRIREPPANLEDDDLLEMVNAGLMPAVVVDDYLAAFWRKVFTNVVVHDSIPLRTGGTLAIAVRKDNPQLLAALNTFMGKYGLGSAFGNQIERRYLIDATYAKSATSVEERKTFLAVVDLFRKYSDRYQVDFLLMAAQGYQESRLNHKARSPVGAIGIMQIMPKTGHSLKVGDIRQLEPNIHAGVKYMRTVRDTYFKDEPMDDLNKALFTFASYNAGASRVRQLRNEARKRGLNPNVWFGNVEQIASERIGRETVTYVANIFKYYIAYRLLAEETERRAAARSAIAK